MIGLTASTAKSIEQQLAMLGLLLIEDHDYCVTFASSTHTLRAERDRYYPGLSVSLKNSCGEVFELGLLAKLLAPQWYAEFQARSLPLQNIDSPEAFDLTGIACFLQDNKATVFDIPAPISVAYQEQSRLRLEKLGLCAKI